MRLFWYWLRGGQEDALAEIARNDERLAPLKALGADIDARIQDAVILECCGVNSELVRWLARVSAQGALTHNDLQRLGRLNIDIHAGEHHEGTSDVHA